MRKHVDHELAACLERVGHALEGQPPDRVMAVLSLTMALVGRQTGLHQVDLLDLTIASWKDTFDEALDQPDVEA